MFMARPPHTDWSTCLVAPALLTVLDEANGLGLLAEAAAADQQTVLADEALARGANAAFAGALAILGGVRFPGALNAHDVTGVALLVMKKKMDLVILHLIQMMYMVHVRKWKLLVFHLRRNLMKEE
jgi:hypothetical protein